jgi:hypothetical protein
MPPTPSKTKKSDSDKLLDAVLADVRKDKALKDKTVAYRDGALNAKGEKLLKVDGVTLAYVSVLEGGEVRALKRSIDLKAKGDSKTVARDIVAKFRANKDNLGRVRQSAKTSPTASAKSGKTSSGGTTRQKQTAARRQAKTTGATQKPAVDKTPNEPTTEPKTAETVSS